MSASRTIVAAYPGTCRKCGAKFPAGTKVHWSGKGSLAHDACPGAAAPEPERPRCCEKCPPGRDVCDECAEYSRALSEANAPVEDADLDELIALDDALSGVPLVGAVGAGGVEGHATLGHSGYEDGASKSAAKAEDAGTCPPARHSVDSGGGSSESRDAQSTSAAGVEPGPAPTASKADTTTVEALQQALRELHAITRDLAASVRVLTSAAERIARPETPVPAGHWTAALPPTEAGAELEPGDPL